MTGTEMLKREISSALCSPISVTLPPNSKQQVKNFPNEVQADQSPKDVSSVFGANPQEESGDVNVTVNENVTKNLIDYAWKGIFKAHKKTIGWVIGAI